MEYEGHELRHEIKFYINEATYNILKERFRYILQKDENTNNEEGYTISSLYFDDIFDTAFKEKVNGTRFRKKYRIRIYNHNDQLIKLECKSKYDSFISKKSVILNRTEYNYILLDEYDFLIQKKENICKELYTFHNTKLLHPVTVIEYNREAYVSAPGNVRITFDKSVSTSILSIDIFNRDFVTKEVFPQGVIILEVKYDDFIPQYILNIIQIGMTQKCAISKYVMGRKMNRRVRQL